MMKNPQGSGFPMKKSELNRSLGINIVGHIKGEYGLGEAVRANIRSIEAAQIPYTLKDISVDWHRNLDDTYTDFSDDNPYPINLIQINPAAELYNIIGDEYFRGRYNIGYWAWEMLDMIPGWEPAFGLFDEIWTLSNHCAESIAAVSPIPVIKVMPSLVLPQPFINRELLGLPQEKFIFFFMFDFHSTTARKNPQGLIEAFQKAFGKENKNVLLVIKFSNSKYHPEQRVQLNELVEGYPSIKFIDGHLKKEEVNALLYNCDCYVSLHRAEGFGLTMAEAMFYGKPVIATAYSSNIEFMNVGNSFLVKYQLVPNADDYGSFPKGSSIWAEPDIDHAASLMQYVFHNYEQAQQVGAIAANEIKSLLSPLVIGKKIKRRLEYIMKFSNRIKEIQAEKTWWESQAQAWKKTAYQAQMELIVAQSQLKETKS
jgi:glycosyltransferase involved in cell wall biosynthesis